jgi:hypothetical protein
MPRPRVQRNPSPGRLRRSATLSIGAVGNGPASGQPPGRRRLPARRSRRRSDWASGHVRYSRSTGSGRGRFIGGRMPGRARRSPRRARVRTGPRRRPHEGLLGPRHQLPRPAHGIRAGCGSRPAPRFSSHAGPGSGTAAAAGLPPSRPGARRGVCPECRDLPRAYLFPAVACRHRQNRQNVDHHRPRLNRPHQLDPPAGCRALVEL